ncbi:bifunctional hydroxymethylpyrimidine kinase/phosphomethylpyrimidine kinase [Pseudoruegeria sp. SK021]|uniref:bifunctional hydroxymethylpyrimidine kinase/phosphomethylpyrimidine kinase n=1 Tax=Pseudoruegeria sp. SK021 TaxID=1933035 RepID=UPI000A228417|nr:bifunctional hydroxymethylpyrimidine kinase/phosphomethylpyrimidine kinase [Pseudoruegeria sp. SK021]OSP53560.1 bifunctional hydroxymethylpyrimidine kinase/phosphomethylpyrimidine kinase [Pseudoruegeria sp. SK021]
MTDRVPIALTIAGSDSGGGAGIQADLKTFSALGVYGASAITAITAQNTQVVSAVHEVPADVVAAQIAAVLDDLNVAAIKIGMLFSARLIDVVAARMAHYAGPVVLDPVMIAKSGDALLQGAAIAAMTAQLLPRADLLTPNLPEAARLLGAPQAQTPDEAAAQGRALLALGPRAVLMKGGHAQSGTCTDLLVRPGQPDLAFSAPRVETRNTHGTGCTYSAAIAAGLAKGLELSEAIGVAHDYLQGAIRQADGLKIGAGHGPVHHFHQVWGAA